MPVDGDTDIDLGITEEDLEKIDRAAAKAQKSLEKRNAELKKTKTSLESPPLTQQDKTIEKRMKKLEKKIKADEAKQLGDKETILDKILGKTTAGNIMSMGKNPKNFIFGIAKTLPWLGGIFAAKDIAEFIVDEIAKIDRFLKVFIDEVDKRVDAFRSLQVQAEVQAGLTQRIITTASGSTEPRYSYNTFEQFNSNQAELEQKFQMTNNSGVD